MPISSLQINQMIAGQQAMFGNAATYAQQISPMGQAMGMAPSYAQPYGPMAIPGAQEYNQGAAAAPGIMNAAASYGAPIMMGAGMMMGGRVGGMLDPTTAAFRGFGAGAGWQSGAGITANLGNIARGGIGGIARGIGMAGLYAAPVMGMYAAGKYALGQMAEGAQFQNQVNATLQNAFRFTNPQSQTGYGFSQVEQRQIGSMLQGMGTQDMMTTPQELLGLVQRGTQMGVFRGVQDAREFRQKFTEMKNSLKEIAQTFNTTLSEAVPFFQQARSQGFWTPQDITRHASQVRQVQATTGMSASQAQAVMGMGAQMVRSIGGTGQQGSEMMARAQMMSGAMLRGGWISSAQLGEAGFGTGAEGAQNFGMMMASASTRFARSGVGRWALAAMMNKEGTGLDPAMLQRMAAGGLGIGEIGSRARGNVSGARAYQFVMNEEDLRGQLAEQGPMAQMGFVRSIIGGRLYGESGRDRLVTRRLIQRFMGGTSRQADMFAEAMRNMPQIMAQQAAASEGALDAQERQNERMMNDTWEGFKRKIGQTWREKVTNPLREAGADFSYRVGRAWSRFSDRLWGTGGRGMGLSAEAVRSMVRSAETGNQAYMADAFGGRGVVGDVVGAGLMSGGGLGIGDASRMMRMGFTPTGIGRNTGGIFAQMISPYQVQFGAGALREMETLGRASRGMVGEEEAMAIGYRGAGEMREAMGGRGAQQVQEFLRTGEALRLRGQQGGWFGYKERLSGEEQENYAKQVLTRIRAGRAGAQAQQMFQGLNERQAIGRLMAMQGQARGGLTGLGDFEGVTSRRGQDIREAIEEAQTKSTEDLAALMRGGARDAWYDPRGGVAGVFGGLRGVAVTEQGIEELRKDARGERAMQLFARATRLEKQGKPEEAAAARQEARRNMADIALEGKASKSAISAAIRMSDATDPQAKAIAETAGKLGTAMNAEQRKEFDDTVRRRRMRLTEGLRGGTREELEERAGGLKSGLSQALNAVLSTAGDPAAGGMISPEQHAAQMETLVREAAKDPEKAAGMLAVLNREGLAKSDIAVALQGAMAATGEAKRFGIDKDIATGGAITDRARRGIRKRLADLDISDIKGADIDQLIRGSGAGVEKLRERLKGRGFRDEDVAGMLGEMRGGLTTAELREGGVRRAKGLAIQTLDERVAKRGGLDPKELQSIMKEGGSAEVQELKKHTALFGIMNEKLDYIARQEKMPQKNQKGQK